MPRKQKKEPKELPSGCLSLFGLPFLVAGLFLAGIYFNGYLKWASVQGWEKTPCRILEVELGTDHDSEGGTTHRVSARYEYFHQGQRHIGDRVTIHEGGDNIGRFQRRAYHELRQHRDAALSDGLPNFTCYVNPDDPRESILYHVLRWELQCFMAAFALTFPAVGAGLVFGGILATRLRKREQDLATRHPGQPWKARSTWADESAIPESNSPWRLALHAYTVWSALIIAPLILFTALSGAYRTQPLSWLTLILVAGWMVPAWFSSRHWRHLRAVGAVHFRPARTPFVPGGAVEGSIVMKRPPPLRRTMEAALICEKKTTIQGSDGDETTSDRIWEQRELIPLDGLGNDIDGHAIALSIRLPDDAPDSGKEREDANTEHVWKLCYKIPGTMVSGAFELPVFRTGGSPQDSRPANPIPPGPPGPPGPSKSILDQSLEHLPEQLRDFGIRSIFDEDRIPVQLTSPPCRSPWMLVFLLLFNLVWTTAAVWLVVAQAPLLFRIIWPVTAAGIWLQIFWMLLHKREVRISADSIRITNQLGPLLWSEDFSKADIVDFDHHSSVRSGNKSHYKVRLLSRSGSKGTLVDSVTSSATAKALVHRLRAWLARP